MFHIKSGILPLVLQAALLRFAMMAAQAVETGNPDSCGALETADFTHIMDAPTKVIHANVNSTADGVLNYCKVEGYVSPAVGFELRMPISSWNGKLLMLGCGSYCGTLLSKSCEEPLHRGYACIVTDMGHKAGRDALWAFNNMQAEVDYAYRATHVTTVAGKSILKRYYSSSPDKSYFMGCSTGGRQALVEAQRFPWDFDGIVAGSPAVSLNGSHVGMLWGMRAVIGDDDRAILGEDEVSLVHAAALDRCDSDDGLEDDIIGNPLSCKFDPAELSCRKGQTNGCLAPRQLAAVKKLYSGPVTSGGIEFYKGATMPGSEMLWLKYFIGSSAGRSPYYDVVADLFRYSAFVPNPGPNWQLEEFDFDRDYKRLGMTETLSSGASPDLRQFKANGGKLIAYMGWNDILVENFVDYYQISEKTMGGREATQDFFRAFMVPGMNHCSGGPGAYAVDYLSYLEAWVEDGEAPNVVIGTHPRDGTRYPKYPIDAANVRFTRPHYPFPTVGRYRGTGDPNDAANFQPVKP